MKKILIYSITGLVFLIGAGAWVWLRDYSGFSFTFGTSILVAGFIGAMVGLVNSLIKK